MSYQPLDLLKPPLNLTNETFNHQTFTIHVIHTDSNIQLINYKHTDTKPIIHTDTYKPTHNSKQNYPILHSIK